MNVRGRILICAAVASGATLGGPMAAPGIAAADQILPSGPHGVTYIRTESGPMLCGIEDDRVNCTVQFVDPPPASAGDVPNSVSLNQNGTFTYLTADLGVIHPPHLILCDQTYITNGWAMEAFDDGTRFTNNRTNEGFWVSVTDVDALGQV